jgi:hypothetical protein
MTSAEVLQTLQALYGSSDWSNWQIQRWPMYDEVRYPTAGTVNLPLFQVPLGGVDPNSSLGKTAEQTNVMLPGCFGNVYYIINQVRTLGYLIPFARQHATIIADADVIFTTYTNCMDKLLELQRRGVLTMTIGYKQYLQLQSPLLRAPYGAGVDIDQHSSSFISAGSAWTKAACWVNPDNDEANVYNQTPPQIIEPNQSFQMNLSYPDGTGPVFTTLVDGVSPAVNVVVMFDGYIVRPSQ